MSNLRNGHVLCHYIFYPPCRMSLSPMSHVEFKKYQCRPVNFRGQGPYLFLKFVEMMRRSEESVVDVCYFFLNSV